MSSSRYIKVLGLLAAMMAFSAIGVGAAQAAAPVWTTKTALGVTATLGSTEERSANISSTGTVALAFPGTTLRSTTNGDCTSTITIKGTTPGTITSFILHCKNVEATVANCTPSTQGVAGSDKTIISTGMKGTLVWLEKTGHATGVLFQPNSGTAFAHIEETGAACAVATEGASLTVTGELLCKVTKGVDEDVIQGEFNCPVTQITKYWDNTTPTRLEKSVSPLKIAGAGASFTGTFDVTPETAGEAWGIETG
jgi:hypothetical protein